MTIFELLQSTGRPVAYGYHSKEVELPYLCVIGAGQDVFEADNTYYTTKNRTQIEYYFKRKNEAAEAELESLLLSNGYKYEKSEDVYLDDQDVYLIYYDV